MRPVGWSMLSTVETALASDGSERTMAIGDPPAADDAGAAERRAAERALRASEARHRRLLETAGVVPWEGDPGMERISYVGPQAAELLRDTSLRRRPLSPFTGRG